MFPWQRRRRQQSIQGDTCFATLICSAAATGVTADDRDNEPMITYDSGVEEPDWLHEQDARWLPSTRWRDRVSSRQRRQEVKAGGAVKLAKIWAALQRI